MKYESIGIDLGDNYIKMVSGRKSRDYVRINAANYFEVSEQLDMKDYMKYLKECVRTFMKANKIKFASLSFTIPLGSNWSTVIFADMPVLKKRLLQKSISYEIEENPGVSDSKNIYTKWAITETNQDTGINRIMILAVERILIAELSKVGGINCKIENVELQPLTMGRNLGRDAMVIDFGQGSTKMHIYKKEALFNTTSFSFGGKAIDQMIEDEFGRDVDNDKRDEVKGYIFVGTNPYDGEEIDESVEIISRRLNSKMPEIIDEIKSAMRSMEIQHDLFINTVYITGGISNTLGFLKLLTYELGVDVEPLNTFVLSDDSVLTNNEVRVYYSAISAAMFKEYPYFKALGFGKLANTQIDYMSFTVLALCASILIHGAMFDIHNKYDNEISLLEGQVGRQNPIISSLEGEISTMNSQIDEDGRFILRMEKLQNRKEWLSDVLYMLSVETPKETAITGLSLAEGKLVIQGYAQHYSAIGFLSIGLENHGTVSIDSIVNQLDGNYYTESGIPMTKQFEITLNYKGRMIDEIEIDRIKGITDMEEDDEALIEEIEDDIERIYEEENPESETIEGIDN